MNETITSREELLLAKIAGHDVDIKTMTPPVASNLSEKFMLEIADRLDGMGGTGETYESVFEMEIGDMEESEMGELSPVYAYSKILDSMPDLPDELYLNSADYPLTKIDETGGAWYLYNVDPKSGAPLRQEEPIYFILFETGSGDDDSVRFSFASDSPDLSNKTIKLLQKVGGEPSGGGKFVVTVDEDKNVEGLYHADKSVAQCIAAYNAGQTVVCSFEGQDVPLFVIEDGAIAFSITSLLSGTIASVMVQGTPDDGDDSWDVVAEQRSIPDGLKPTKVFDFTAASDGHGGKTITPASGVTYSAVYDEWEHDAEIIFKLTEGNDVTKFHVKSHVGSASPKYFDCTELAYLGTNGWAGVFLTFDENSTATMQIQPLAARS